jgi:hypothetical protein
LIKPTAKCYCCFACEQKKKEPKAYFHFFVTLPILPIEKQGWVSVKYFILEWGYKDEKCLESTELYPSCV